MPDITPYQAGDASDADRLRHLKQQYHEAAEALRTSTPEQTVERQSLKALGAEIKYLEAKISRSSRMHTVWSKHARAV